MTQFKGPKRHEDFDSISLSVASPDSVLEWSHGEVTKPETINYRTQKPERDGLFCEKIFGPTKNWECYCGKYKRIRYKGVVCEKCGVEVTRSIVRRERMGHISLAVPVTHIWFLRSTPSRLGLLLDLPIKAIEQVIYFAAYIVTEVDLEAKKEALENLDKDFQTYKKQIQEEFKNRSNDLKIKSRAKKDESLSEEDEEALAHDDSDSDELIETEDMLAKKIEELTLQHSQAKDDLEELRVGMVLGEIEYRELSMKFGHVFHAGTGAESIRKILENLDLKTFVVELEELRKKSTGQKYKKLLRRIRLASALTKAKIRPEWMVVKQLPVIPPDLRPMVQLDGGRFAASDLNDLYRRVINRNNRLKRLMAIGAPEVICRNEKRMLQEAVDTLFNNAARAGRAVFTAGDKRKLRSLSDMLKGKQGRFRQNLLGKRVDYSGRSVIVVGPRLKLSECGLPKEMALKLFKPFVIGELIKQELAHNVKGAERLIDEGTKEVWDILENETQKRLVLLNRAPTLHRLGIQAFKPVLIDGKAIQIHPLVCAAFNADFDGDQMAVHLPLSKKAQDEARALMLATTNLLKPSAGEPIITPSQDMVLGVYYLTQAFEGKNGEGMMFSDLNEAINAYRMNYVDLQALVTARMNGEIIEKTTVGRLIFNSFLPEQIDYVNEAVGKNGLKDLLADILDKAGPEVTAGIADEFKRVGFKFATKSGITISAFDMLIPEKRQALISEVEGTVKKINNQYWKGWITEDERYHHAIRLWSALKSSVTGEMIKKFEANPENNIYYMIDSGARGNWGQITQLCGMKGLVANPSGKTIELPIKSNLKGGFSILEYFIATHGGRKGKSDTALKTAEAGYLTRRLVDAVQDVIIANEEEDEATHIISREESARIGIDFENRLYGRVAAREIKDGKNVLLKKGQVIEAKLARVIQDSGVEEVEIFSIMGSIRDGISIKGYGLDLGSNQMVDVGTAVGIIAAQSIGEPGTQLTMRTFHMGGVAEGSDITQGLTRVEELFEARSPKNAALLAEITGKATVKMNKEGVHVVIEAAELGEDSYRVPSDYEPVVEVGDKIKPKQIIARSQHEKGTLKASEEGEVKSIKGGAIILKHTEKRVKEYNFSRRTRLAIADGDLVLKGQSINSGHINLQHLMELTNVMTVMKYIMSEVHHIYASQGQTINEKHIEIIVKQMFSKVRIVQAGDSNFLPGEMVTLGQYETSRRELKKAKKVLPHGDRLLLGISRVAISTNSWLSAASFQETIRVLVEAATTRKIDQLKGLKENVIIGKLIPAGHVYKAQYENKNT